MKLTYKGDYALKIILDLAQYYEKGLVRVKDISERQDIPKKYLEQIILILKGAGYVRSRRGPDGGIALAKPPEKIRLGEIIRLTDGATSPITCVSKTEPSSCRAFAGCPFVDMWRDIRDYTNRIVDHTTFADMLDRVKIIETTEPDYAI
ncbi:MAG: Rrf2 family transcriptional regulator [Endomicrobiia bacterium]|nr:Rrf2 family transcriptional regulator [Endomicrobiia bacterium]